MSRLCIRERGEGEKGAGEVSEAEGQWKAEEEGGGGEAQRTWL